MTKAERPLWLWLASAVVVLSGIIGGGSIYVAGRSVWRALQPKSYVFGWDVIAVLAFVGLIWIAAVVAVARRHRGRARCLFLVLAALVGGASFAADMIPSSADETVEVELILPPA